MSIQTRRRISLVCFVASVTGLLVLLSWFWVRGPELRLPKSIPADCRIIFARETRNPDTNEYEMQELPLTRDQLTEVLTLVEKSTFWRIPSSTITHNEAVNYHIYCEFSRDTRQESLVLSFIGNYAAAVTSSIEELQQDGFLRILNKNFLNELESVMIP